MKRNITYVLLCFAFIICACSKGEAPPASPGDTPPQVYTKVEQAAFEMPVDNCASLSKKIAVCAPYQCRIQAKMPAGAEYSTIFSIKGEEDGLCVYSQHIINTAGTGSMTECKLNAQNKQAVGDYFYEYFSTPAGQRNIGITNPFVQLMKDGACKRL